MKGGFVQGGMPVPVNEAGVHLHSGKRGGTNVTNPKISSACAFVCGRGVGGKNLEIFEKFEHGNATFIAVHPCSLVPGIAAPLVEAVGVTAQRQVTAQQKPKTRKPRESKIKLPN